MPHDTTVIIPQFNHCHLTRDCVATLLAAHPRPPEILIADDGSDPLALGPDVDWLSRHARLLRLQHRGVTATWNSAARACDSRWLVFLNNDTTTLGPWIDRLLDPLRTGAARLTGVQWRSERELLPHQQSLLPDRHLLAGWCFAIARDVLLRMGGFDESLTLYFSDTDLQLRLLSGGADRCPLLAVEGLPLLHAGHATAHRLPDQRRQWLRDRRRFRSLCAARWPATGLQTASATRSPPG